MCTVSGNIFVYSVILGDSRVMARQSVPSYSTFSSYEYVTMNRYCIFILNLFAYKMKQRCLYDVFAHPSPMLVFCVQC